MKHLKRILLILAVIVLVSILHPIFGRSTVLAAVPFVITLLLLIKLRPLLTLKIGIVSCLLTSLVWALNYSFNNSILTGVGIGIVTFITCILGVLAALGINKLLKN